MKNEARSNSRECHRLRAVGVAVSAALAASAAWALPAGPQVVVGNAVFSQQAGALTVTNTPGTIINWRGFSIGANEATRFTQQSAQSGVLNRVLGPDASSILGVLQTNGQVWLVTPNGVVFGPAARIDVQGLVASTLAVSDSDFVAGRQNFRAGAVAGGIRNQGEIKTPRGGRGYLVAADLENSGMVNPPAGDVILPAGREVSLVEATRPDVQMVVYAPTDRVVNLGQILTRTGPVSLFGAILEQRGVISASTVTTDSEGRSTLSVTGTFAASDNNNRNNNAGGNSVNQAASKAADDAEKARKDAQEAENAKKAAAQDAAKKRAEDAAARKAADGAAAAKKTLEELSAKGGSAADSAAAKKAADDAENAKKAAEESAKRAAEEADRAKKIAEDPAFAKKAAEEAEAAVKKAADDAGATAKRVGQEGAKIAAEEADKARKGAEEG